VAPLPILTVADAIDAARSAYDGLVELAEEVDDEWSYVNDLATAWRDRFDEVAAVDGRAFVGPGVLLAVATLDAEAASIDDPHRAIDWLSTFPQVLLTALGARP
jgi:hypothetical protein